TSKLGNRARHAFAHRAVGKRTDTCLQVVHQMLNPAGSWDGAGDRRVRDHKLEKELRPTRATDFRSPAGQRFAPHLAEQIRLHECSIWRIPASRPLVHTLVARKSL